MNNDRTNKVYADIICQVWNMLDGSLLEPILSDDFEYISFWVIENMEGKNRYIDYIKGKFNSIRKGDRPVSAHVIYQQDIDKYVVILNQVGNLAALEPTVEDNQIKTLWMRPVEMTLPAVFTTKRPEKERIYKEQVVK